MNGYVLAPEAGESRWMFDSLDTIKADAAKTGGALAVVEFLDFEGSGPPVHVHERCDQAFYVLEGTVTFVVDGATESVTTGGFVFVPRGAVRGWRCESPRARVLAMMAPAGFEAFYREVGIAVHDRTRLPAPFEPDVEALAATAARHGATIVGPPI